MATIELDIKTKVKLDRALLQDVKRKINKIKIYDLDKKYFFTYSDFIDRLLKNKNHP